MTRSSIWQRSIALNILIGILLLIMLLNFLVIGLLIDKILAETFPGQDPIVVFNGILLYYLGLELFLRFMVQELPVLNIETYLHLPIKRSTIVHYVAGKSIVAFGNYLPLLIAVPFAIKVVATTHGSPTGWLWLAGFMIMVFANNFLATYLKRQLTGRAWIVAVFGILLLGLILLDNLGLVSITSISSAAFGYLITQPLILIIPITWLFVAYGLNYFYLKGKLYPEEVIPHRQEKIDSIRNIRYLENKGLAGQLAFLDLRLIWRHKRTRTIIYMAPIFLLYGFFFYPQELYLETNGMLIFVGIFMTGGMMLNYTNYCFSYESNYFDNILANYKDYRKYIQVKFIIAVVVSTVCYLLTIPYVLFGAKVLLINTMAYLYNVGVLSMVLFWTATYSTKRMDLSKGAAFNYQGLGASHWLAMIPAFLMPVLIYLPFSLLGFPTAGLITIGALGIVGLLLHKTLMNMLLKQFLKRRYTMAEGFRE